MTSGWHQQHHYRRWIQKAERVGRDSLQLFSAMIRAASNSVVARTNHNNHHHNNMLSVRDVLVQHARRSNSVAVSLLHVDREVGLLRYWGLSGYLRQKNLLPGSSGSTTNHWEWTRRWFSPLPTNNGGATTTTATKDGSPLDATSTTSTTELPKPPKARVAFMVTAAMRQELAGRLEYSDEQIKRLTPLQASLILQSNVPSHEMSSKLPELEQEHYDEQQQFMQQQKHEAAARVFQQQQQQEQQQRELKEPNDAEKITKEKEDSHADNPLLGEKWSSSSSHEGKAPPTLMIGNVTPPPPTTTKSSLLGSSANNKPGNAAPTTASPPTTTTSSSSSLGTSVNNSKPAAVKEQDENLKENDDDDEEEEDDDDEEEEDIDTVHDDDDIDFKNVPPHKLWYELVEHDALDNSSTTVGLFRDATEADLALQTRELFAKRRAHDKKGLVTVSFDITRVIR